MSTVTQRLGIVGSPGSGKTHLATVLIEELLRCNVPTAVIDPEGALWGLQSSADGRQPGFKVAILGGDRGDRPLSPGNGPVVADFFVDTRQPLILDLSDMDDDEQAHFVGAFAQRLYKRNREPAHLVVDEADKFVPETPMDKSQIVSRRGLRSVVQRARKRGLGCTLVTQRPAIIDKTVLNLIACLFAFNTPAPLDQAAIEKWMVARTGKTKKERDEFVMSLATLQRGVAWMWSPSWLQKFEKVVVRQRTTFDSSKTPEFGEQHRTPARQQINLASLDALLATAGAAPTADLDELQRQLGELQRQLRDRPSAEPRTVEVPVLREEEALTLKTSIDALAAVSSGMYEMLKSLEVAITQLDAVQRWGSAPPMVTTSPVNKHAGSTLESLFEETGERAEVQRQAAAKVATMKEGPSKLRKGEREILAALAALGPRLSRTQVGTMVGIKPTGSTMGQYVGTLRRCGHIEESGTDLVLTKAGRAAVPARAPLTAADVLSRWRGRLRAGERNMLDAILRAGSTGVTRAGLAASVGGIRTKGSTLGQYIGTLRRNALIVERDERFYVGPALALLTNRERAVG